MGKSLSNFLNPFSKSNPLRPDNFMKTSVRLAKNPFSKTAQHASYGDFDYDPQADEKAIAAAGSPQPDGTYATPVTGWQRAISAFVREGAPGANGAAYGSSAWNNAFNAWAGKALELNGAYDAADRGEVSDPFDLWSDSWNLEEVTNVTTGGPTVPLEQDLLNRTLQDYVYPALDADKANKENAQRILSSYQPAIDAAKQLTTDMLATDANGNTALLNRELAALGESRGIIDDATRAQETSRLSALDESQATKQSALDTYSASRLAALTEELGSREAALDVLNQERLSAAEGQVTAINLAQQTAADRIAADNASNGYIGGSSFQDAQLARSLLGARQDAANVVGQAKVTNATDSRTLADYGASEKRSLLDEGATGNLSLANTGADERRSIFDQTSGTLFNTADWYAKSLLGYKDADTQRRLANIGTPITLAGSELGLQDTVNDAGWDGLNRSLAALDWWKSNATPSTATTAPTSESTPSWAASVGPSLANAGITYLLNNKTS